MTKPSALNQSTSPWRAAGSILQLMLLLVAFSSSAQAQFDYTIEEGMVTITAYAGLGEGEAVTVPDTIENLPVTTIGVGVFFGVNLSSVTISDNVTRIESLNFYENEFLTSVIIGRGVTNIDDQLFYACPSLTNVTLGSNVARIGNLAFFNCSSLTNIIIPSSVSRIGNAAFYGCASLAEINIPNHVTSIGYNTFTDCARLTNAVIGQSVATIGDSAFSFCTNLAVVFFRGDAPDLGSEVFPEGESPTIYYLPGTAGWSSVLAGLPTTLWNLQALTGDAVFGVRTNQFGFTITGLTNQVVVVEASTNLSNPAWIPLQTNILVGGLFYFRDSQWTNYPHRFYRLRSP